MKYDVSYLDRSLIWLNDLEIRELTSTPAFTREDQLRWFNSIPQKSDYIIWGIEANGIPVGACGLKNIIGIEGEYWGYIGDKSYWGRGIGTKVLIILAEEAKKLGMKSIWLKVGKDNVRAISLYKKNEYKTELETNNFLFMRKYL